METKRPTPAPDPDEQSGQAKHSGEMPPPGEEGLSSSEIALLRGIQGEKLPDSGESTAEDAESSSEALVASSVEGLNALLRVTSRISRYLNLTTLLDEILDAVLDISRCERGFILLANQDGRLDFMAGRDRERKSLPSQEAKYTNTLALRAFRSRRPVLKENLQNLPPGASLTESMSVLELETVICLPLIGAEDVVGVLYLDSRAVERLAASKDLSLLEAFASQATIAIENAQLHEQVARQRDSLAMENRQLRQEVEQAVAFENIVGQSPPMKSLFQAMERVLDVQTQVLILGETGTGKDLVAKALHFHGDRRDGPFIKAELLGLNVDLVHSILFGHKKGAFTDAVADKAGYFELADQGTLLLSEVGDLPLRIQGVLLDAVQDKKIKRLGEEGHERPVNVRIISATNRNLEEMMKRGEFREDLYYRLNAFTLHLPPLRERGDDIRLLCEHFLTRLCEDLKRPRTRITPEAYRLIYSYAWPGNVRELEHAIERAVVLADPGEPLGPAHFPMLASGVEEVTKRFEGHNLREKMEAAERLILQNELEASGWNISQCARRLGCTRQHLHNRIRRLGIQRPERV